MPTAAVPLLVNARVVLCTCARAPGRPTTVNIMDNVRVPAGIAPGEYILGFRWHCELTAQVWNGCSDITIAAADASQE